MPFPATKNVIYAIISINLDTTFTAIHPMPPTFTKYSTFITYTPIPIYPFLPVNIYKFFAPANNSNILLYLTYF